VSKKKKLGLKLSLCYKGVIMKTYFHSAFPKGRALIHPPWQTLWHGHWSFKGILAHMFNMYLPYFTHTHIRTRFGQYNTYITIDIRYIVHLTKSSTSLIING
jgi:hypothetical protein